MLGIQFGCKMTFGVSKKVSKIQGIPGECSTHDSKYLWLWYCNENAKGDIRPRWVGTEFLEIFVSNQPLQRNSSILETSSHKPSKPRVSRLCLFRCEADLAVPLWRNGSPCRGHLSWLYKSSSLHHMTSPFERVWVFIKYVSTGLYLMRSLLDECSWLVFYSCTTFWGATLFSNAAAVLLGFASWIIWICCWIWRATCMDCMYDDVKAAAHIAIPSCMNFWEWNGI